MCFDYNKDTKSDTTNKNVHRVQSWTHCVEMYEICLCKRPKSKGGKPMSSRRVKMTQKLLKDSLIELMEQKNIRQISIKEICEQADVSRSTFYTYYGSQYDLLDAIRKEIIEANQQMAAKEENHDELHTRMLLERHFQYILDHIRMFMAFSTGSSEDYEIPRRTMQIILLPYIDSKLVTRKPPVTADEYEHVCLFCIF